jgi:lipoprotein-anchoring transpeptidase ErfK/SrfK
MKRSKIKYGLYGVIGILILFPYGGFYWLHSWYDREVDKISNSRIVIVSKEEMRLYVFDYEGNQLAVYPCALGASYGSKNKVGDMKTPEGVFRVQEIQKSSTWSHDFKDGNGIIQGAYGPFFIRLYIPGHSGIGIHGTHDANSLGTRATEGCIRLENKNITQLAKYVKSGTVVIITPSALDISLGHHVE